MDGLFVSIRQTVTPNYSALILDQFFFSPADTVCHGRKLHQLAAMHSWWADIIGMGLCSLGQGIDPSGKKLNWSDQVVCLWVWFKVIKVKAIILEDIMKKITYFMVNYPSDRYNEVVFCSINLIIELNWNTSQINQLKKRPYPLFFRFAF